MQRTQGPSPFADYSASFSPSHPLLLLLLLLLLLRLLRLLSSERVHVLVSRSILRSFSLIIQRFLSGQRYFVSVVDSIPQTRLR